jgi:DNA helicase-2/ATP-dependent DNA helicase PcrA
MNSPLLDGLNEPQQQAVLHEAGPLLIFAGAGSGKTSVLTRRIAYLIRERYVRPYNILAVTFTNKAAAEMKDRIVKLVGETGTRGMLAGTFHSLCARILRVHGDLIGLDNRFVIYDDGDQLSIVKEAAHELNLDDKQYAPRALLARISKWKEELRASDTVSADYIPHPFERAAAKVYKLYQEKLTTCNALDFDDLIMKTVQLLKESEKAREIYQERFHYVHCDEFQDVNQSQYELLSLFAAKHGNICVVGDDDQSIYAFRGANVQIILDFKHDFPNATIIKLEQNYRSTKTILDAAYHVVKNNRRRAEKRLWTENDEGEKITLMETPNEVEEAVAVVNAIREGVNTGDLNYSDYAVLYRANAQSRAMEEQLINYRIPYKIVGGVRFYDRREIKDVLAYLRVIVNPYDAVSLRRIINVPARAIGVSTVERIADFATDTEIAFWDACRRAGEVELPSRAKNNVKAFVALIEYLQTKRETPSVADLIQNVLDTTGYLEALKKEKTQESLNRIENIGELISVAREFEESPGEDEDKSLSAFLENVALVSDVDSLEDSANTVTLMTLHSAKGLEFPVVFLVGMEEGIFPHFRSMGEQEAMEEERRLCYVGITRAKQELYISFADARMLFGQTQRNPVSRFVAEIPMGLFLAKSARSAGPSSYAVAGRTSGGSTGGFRAAAPPPTWKDVAQNAARRNAEAGASSAFKLGEKVRHADFGLGTVVKLDGDTLLTIAFREPVGIKQLDTGFAKLEKV